MADISDRDIEIYDMIVQYKIDNNGNSPTLLDVQTATGLSRTGAHHALARLTRHGLLEKPDRQGDNTRRIMVPGGVWLPPPGWERGTKPDRWEDDADEPAKNQRPAVDIDRCECSKDAIAIYTKTVIISGADLGRGRIESTQLMCQKCAELEAEMNGWDGIKRIRKRGQS